MVGKSPETFYRALFTPDHFRRWTQGLFTSTHLYPPGDWELSFQSNGGSLNEADYDRINTCFGEMSERSLQTWLQLKREGRDAQTHEERFASGEVPGVCAFRTAQQVLDRYQGEPDDPTLRFVAFRGRYIGPCTPEESQGGVVATVEEILCTPLPRLEFVSKFVEPALQAPSGPS